MAKKVINYSETFSFPDIPNQMYPTYVNSRSGRIINFKEMVYPNPKCRKRYTRRKQLVSRSLQAKIFDSLININYWSPLEVVKEFPVIIRNDKRLKDQKGLFYYLDYYFPTLKLAVELDSDLHKEDKDAIRDKYLKEVYGINTFRITGLDKEAVQKGRFQELVKYVKSITPLENSGPLYFGELKIGK